ncbi:anti-sigma factor [Knoellia sp. LjRoot47]|uniref:anti-sigma factor n=1 Tax=Knoellia sp. LjRoot47 TaxID=3342330 RepID=UPI003ED0CE59
MNATPPPTTAQVDDGRHLADERLVDLALGERLSQPEHDHLDSCPACHDELAAMTRTVTATRAAATVELAEPGPALWSRIADQLAAPDTDEPDAPDMDEPDAARDVVPAPLKVGPAPDVAVLPAPTTSSGSPEVVVPLDRTGLAAGRTGSRARPGLGWLAAACVAGVLLGAGGVVAADRLGDDPAPTVAARTVATAQLDTLDTAQQRGTATVSERADSVTLDVAARDLQPTDGGYVEVWLINRDLKRMVSVGVLDDGVADQSFPISRRLLDEGYVIVDLSREQFDDQPQHSGDSLVRGALTSRA